MTDNYDRYDELSLQVKPPKATLCKNNISRLKISFFFGTSLSATLTDQNSLGLKTFVVFQRNSCLCWSRFAATIVRLSCGCVTNKFILHHGRIFFINYQHRPLSKEPSGFGRENVKSDDLEK